jgi:hypothetical protein
MKINTIHGEFTVRYVYGNIISNIVVDITKCADPLAGPFAGKYGDEIPNTKPFLEKYNVKKTFDDWFPTWKKAKAYEYYSKSQGTGLRRAHSLMQQASRDYEKYLHSKKIEFIPVIND